MTAWTVSLLIGLAATAVLLAVTGVAWHLVARICRYRRIHRRFPWIGRSAAWSLAREVGR